MNTSKYYITSPIYYVNDNPHIGHASTDLICDIIARFKRLDGFTVKFLTGTDEHGQKIEKSAKKANLDPQTFTDQVSQSFKNLSKVMNFSNDDFIRTTEDRHKKTVIDIWQKLKASGSLYLDKYSGWYSVRDETFYHESELIDGRAPTGAEVEWITESSYFFNLSAWQNKLLKFYDENPQFIVPESRKNEVISFVKSGLQDLSVSRTSFQWGIKVPNDEHHVIYVWLDALFNYYSAIDNEREKGFWPCDLHVIGKDILRFHAVYWPAFLMAANLPLPEQVFAHAWWTVHQEKMSKSIGNVISPSSLAEEFGADYTRYFLAREMPYGNDKDFSIELLKSKVTADLCNNIGNLIQRTLTFVNKNCNATVPSYNLQAIDTELLEKAYGSLNNMRIEIEKKSLHSAVEVIIELGAKANEYIDHQAPWNLRKTDELRMQTVLYTLLECIRVIGILLQPIIPTSAEKILKLLNLKEQNFLSVASSAALKSGTPLPSPEIIFPRLV